MRATVDTSAWVSVVLSRRGRAQPVLDALASGRLVLVVSEPIVAETAEVLGRPHVVRTGEARELTRRVLETIRERAEVVSIDGTLSVCRDPNDDPFIETALQGGADVLVTEDNDLLGDPAVVDLLAGAGVRVLTVARFLEALDEDTAAPS